MSGIFRRLGKAMRASAQNPAAMPDQESLFREQEQNAYDNRPADGAAHEADAGSDQPDGGTDEAAGAAGSEAGETLSGEAPETEPAAAEKPADRPKTLILFFTRRGENYVNGQLTQLEKGNTERIVDFIRAAVPADVFEVIPEKPYPEDYMECTRVALREQKEKARPALREYLEDRGDLDFGAYENVVVASPCWWGNWPCPVMTQLERLDFTGKNVWPVMTHEGSGFGKSVRTLKRTCRGAKVGRGLAVHGGEAADAERPVTVWAKANLL